MSDPITYGGVVVTVFFVVLSLRAEKWWPVFYAPAVLLWFSTGVLAWSWPEGVRDAWWFVWLVYCFALPLGKIEERRHKRAAERETRWAHALREGASVDCDGQDIFVRNDKGEIIYEVPRVDVPRAGA